MDPRRGINRRGREGGEGILEEAHQESRGEATPWVTGEQTGGEEERISLHPDRAEQQQQQRENRPSSLDRAFQEAGAAPSEEPLMEPCLTLQRGVFNQCNRPAFSICVCVCLPPEPEGGLLAAAMAMVVMVVMVMMMMMMIRLQWRCSHGFWLSSLCLLKDSLR